MSASAIRTVLFKNFNDFFNPLKTGSVIHVWLIQRNAVKAYGLNKFAIAGGVASNSSLRAAFEEECGKRNIAFYHPSPIFCTDNAAMIGVAGYYEYIKGVRSGYDLNAVPNLKLGER